MPEKEPTNLFPERADDFQSVDIRPLGISGLTKQLVIPTQKAFDLISETAKRMGMSTDELLTSLTKGMPDKITPHPDTENTNIRIYKSTKKD